MKSNWNVECVKCCVAVRKLVVNELTIVDCKRYQLEQVCLLFLKSLALLSIIDNRM